MFWHRRGHALPEEANSCVKCGAALTDPPADEEDEASPEEGGGAAGAHAIRLGKPPLLAGHGNGSALYATAMQHPHDTGLTNEWEALTESLATYGDKAKSSLPPIPAVLPTYLWFSDENYSHAKLWRDKALQVIHAEGVTDDQKSTANQVLLFELNALIDLYHKDRAAWVASMLKPPPHPVRLAEIPESIKKGGQLYRREMAALTWSPDVPPEVTDLLAITSAVLLPDRLQIVQYQRLPDPMIYAQYGLWYLKIAEWK
jgi:hypothetical protein